MPSTIQPAAGPAIQFLSLRGEIEPLGPRVQEISRRGSDGHAYRLLGLRGDSFEMVGTADYATALAAGTAYVAMKNLQGKVVTVTDDRGLSADDVVILTVTRDSLKPIGGSIGGLVAGSTYLMRVTFTMQKATPPATP